MVEQATASEPLRPPPLPIPATTLLATAFRDVRARWPQALGLWVAGSGVAFGLRGLRELGGAAMGHPSLSPLWLGNMALSHLTAAVLAALTLRLFLAPGRHWWRPDRGFWACVGLLALATAANSALSLLSLGHLARPELAQLGGRILLQFGGQGVVWWIYARLLLWPIGALVGQPAMTPARSWTRMSGQVAGFVGAVIAINLPLFLATAAYMGIDGLGLHHRATQAIATTAVASSLVGPALRVLQHAIAAAVYRARAGTGAETLESWTFGRSRLTVNGTGTSAL